jgi:hypothetical protein
MLRQTLLIVSLATSLFADAASAQPAIRDSAGIRIVTHARTAQARATWRIAPQPVVEIGGVDATGPAMFGRIWGVARAPTGEIVVTEEPAQELRVFSAAGRHLRTFGRKGEGPGEFSQIRGVVIYGDTVYPIDTRRTTIFTLGGKLVRQTPFPAMTPYRPVDPWGALADGSVVQTAPERETMEMARQVGTRIEMRALIRIAADSRSHTVLGVLPTYEHHRGENDPPGGDLVAFQPYMTVAVFGDRICTGRGVRYELACMNAEGKASLIIRRDLEPMAVTAAARDAYLKKIRTPYNMPGPEGRSPPQSRLDQIAARTHFAATFPAFDWTMAGSDGELWVSEFNLQQRTRPAGEQAGANETVNWNVFAADGSWAATIALPARFFPKQAGKDYVLGINRDEDGVQRVTMYRLLRS